MDTEYYKIPKKLLQHLIKYLREQPWKDVNDYLAGIQSEVVGPFELSDAEIIARKDKSNKQEQSELKEES